MSSPAIRPEDHDAIASARRLIKSGDVAGGEAMLRQVLATRPDSADALGALGLAALHTHRYDEASERLAKACTLAPDRADLRNDYGVALQAGGRRREALNAFRKAVARAPRQADFQCNLANILKDLGRFDEALPVFAKSLELDPGYPDAHFGTGHCLLALGRFAEAWPAYEWRSLCKNADYTSLGPEFGRRALRRPSTQLPSDLGAKRLLLAREQGIGDQLFFLRYAPALAARCADCQLLVDEKLAPILRPAFAPGHVLIDPREVGAVDEVVLQGDLPLLAATHPGEIAPPLPLVADGNRISEVRERLRASGPPPYLGVTWRAGADPVVGPRQPLRKAVPAGSLGLALARWPGTVIVLQRNPRAEDRDAFCRGLGRQVADFSPLNDDLAGMLAALMLVDRVVGVSNTNMHLRASLGLPADVLIPRPPEWRWLAEGESNPWFPGFRLYREHPEFGWRFELDRLARSLDG